MEAIFDDLIGTHNLDAVDTFIEKIKTYGDDFEDANAIRFRLDGRVYTAIEDPSDGYRSSMGSLIVNRKNKKDPMVNVFPPVRVLVRKKPSSDYRASDILEFIDIATTKTVLEIGTDNSDDYYPSFVSAFWPEHMLINTAGAE